MRTISQELSNKFDYQLTKNQVPSKDYSLFKKWLRYYIDFCFKYGHDSKHQDILPLFINKLREKKQTREQQKQAYDSILMYYAVYDIRPEWAKQSPLRHETKQRSSVVKEPKRSYAASDMTGWESVYNRLSDEIKIRHYSPKTFKAYRKWVAAFQGFVHNKPLDHLSSDDVRDVGKNNYPILLVFWPVFFVAIKLTYLDMLASSRLEYEPKSFAIWGNYFFPRPLSSS